MPGRRFTRRRMQAPINSIKNQPFFGTGITGTPTEILVAKATNTPLSTVSTDVSNGCQINQIWCSLDVCGLGGTGVLNSFVAYLAKNPGDNLALPAPFSLGTSNEKKFAIKTWSAMIMRNQDGNLPYHWEGWVKVPKVYRRMGTDDTWRLVIECSSALTGHAQLYNIYKWYR